MTSIYPVMILIAGGLCLGALATLCQSGLRDATFDPWLGGVLPATLAATYWQDSSAPAGYALVIAGAAAAVVIALLLLVRVSYGNTTLTGLGIMLFFLAVYGLASRHGDWLTFIYPVETTLSTNYIFMIIITIITALMISLRLDVVQLSERQALLFGLPVKRVKVAVLVVASVLTVWVCVLGAALPLIGILSVRISRRLFPSHLPSAMLTAMVVSALCVWLANFGISKVFIR